MKRNQDIRELIAKKRLRNYEVAQSLNVSEFTLSRWLRDDLSPEKRTKILNAINQAAENLSV
jgi:DNA-binding transcriptional regulator YiaG